MYGSPEDLIGSRLNDTYELERVVGEGAYGTVYEARHVRLSRKVAVKILHVDDNDSFRRFRREAEITSSLGSRFIAQVFDFNLMDDGSPYLVMELLEGEDLAARLERNTTLSLDEALRVCEQVAMALAVAHRHNIVHRDLKPQNIFLCKTEDEGELVKVIDFGISKITDQAGTTAAGQFLGSPLYMSPEQVRGRNDEVDARTDIYALGIVLYEALAGKPAYHADGIFQLVEAISGPELPPPLSEHDPEIPPAVDEVLRKAIAKAPGDRYGTVTELYNALAHAIRTAGAAEQATPAAAIMGTHARETMCATGMVATPMWRGSGRDHELRFVAPEGGFLGGDLALRTLRLGRGKTEFYIGSVTRLGDLTNDLVLPHRQVSRNAVRVTVRDGRVHLRRELKCSVPVRVGLSLLERGEERVLHHGQSLAIGVVAGVLHDGRFVPTQVPAQAVDEQTGLLGREGLAWEVALAARIADGKRLILAVPAAGRAAEDENVACRIALALHQLHGKWPVARFDRYAAALVKRDDDLAAVASAAATAAEVPLLIGHLEVGESTDEAGARIDEARGALTRLAATGASPGLIDLAEHRLVLLEPDELVRRATELAETGGETGLIALEEREQLAELGEAVCAALELELLHIAGRVAGSRTVLCRPTPGAIAFAGPDAAEPIARQIAAEWHARGPVRGNVLEVERSVAIAFIEPADLGNLARRAHHLVSGASAGVEGFPQPIAAAARAALSATGQLERARAMVCLVEATWRFLAICLGSMAAAARASFAAGDDGEPWAEPWRSRAIAAGVALADAPGRVGELARAIVTGAQPCAPLVAADQRARDLVTLLTTSPDRTEIGAALPPLASAIAELLLALRPLRGWTLAAVLRVDRVDVFGDSEAVDFIDYTGSYQRGTPRQITLIKDLRIGPFVYLARFAEGIVVPLEPHLRRRFCEHTGRDELFWARAPITEPGVHRFTSVAGDHPLTDDVTARQIPRSR